MKKKILLIDDDDHVRRMFLLLLKQEGYSVDTAINGEDALKKLKDSVYDLVISDIHMPKLNGIDLYHRVVKAHPYLKNRFILITGAISDKAEVPFALKIRIFEKACIDEIMERVQLLVMLS